MANTKPTPVASPRLQFSSLLWGSVIALGGATLIVAGVREDNRWYLIAGGAAILLAIPVTLRYERTIIDSGQGVWIRKKGGLFGSRSESGPLNGIVQIRVRHGLDTKGSDYWKVMLVRNGARDIPWHQYTYLGKQSMEQAVTQLEAALGVKADWINSK